MTAPAWGITSWGDLFAKLYCLLIPSQCRFRTMTLDFQVSLGVLKQDILKADIALFCVPSSLKGNKISQISPVSDKHSLND
jgi:hypothetical protein